MTNSEVRVVLCDDHQLILDGLMKLLEGAPPFRVCGVSTNGSELIKLLDISTPHLVLLDINMPGIDGIETLRAIRKSHPEVHVLMLTMHNSPALARQMLQLGASGYIHKNATRNELLQAMHNALNNENAVLLNEAEPSLSRGIHPPDEALVTLSEREREVLRKIAAGKSNKEIAVEMNISHRTVDTHRTNLMRKLNVHNVSSLLRLAYDNGIVES